MNSARVTLESIPHRPPFLFVDEIVERGASRIVTHWTARPEADFLKGHYPGEPVVPGVLICECCFQAGALLLAAKHGPFDVESGVPVVTRIQDARFKRIVRPGQTLRVETTLDDELDGAYFMTGRATIGDVSVARVTFACMRAKPDNEPS
jgi:3-hydroxyacyl-[acyl-carrier-protein] dehydratase